MPESESILESSGIPRPQLEAFDEDAPASSARISPPVREGLPPGFRMRADAHYVDQLDARVSSIAVRLIDTQSLDTAQHSGDTISPAFQDSVKRYGILQPLLVSARGSRYRVIAGRRRLAAALAAGLREVPCLVQHVDAEQAEQLALASNLPAIRPRAAAPLPVAPTAGPSAAAELLQSLSALASCAALLTSGSPSSQAVAADLLKAEVARARDVVTAMRVLRDEVPVARGRVSVKALLDLIARGAAAERRVRGAALRVDAAAPPLDAAAINGDLQLLADAIWNLVSAAASLAEPDAANAPHLDATQNEPEIVLTASSDTRGAVTLSVTQGVVELPAAWLARPFEIAWPIRSGAASLVRLQAARRIAQLHGGDVQVDGGAGGTGFLLTVPVGV